MSNSSNYSDSCFIQAIFTNQTVDFNMYMSMHRENNLK